MGDTLQNTSVQSIMQAQIIPQTRFYSINQQPIKIIKCGPEKIQNVQSTNNTTEVMSLLKTILNKQESLEKRIAEIEKSVFNTEILVSRHVIKTSEVIAQNQGKSDCEVKGKWVSSVDDIFIEIGAELPLVTMDALLKVEEKLSEKEYNESMVEFIKKYKDSTDSVDKVLRQVFADALMKHFNWDGRWGKKTLSSLKLIDQIVFELFKVDGRKSYERNVKRYVELSHNRWKKKMSLEKKISLDKKMILEKKIKQQNDILGYP